jgi:hypothetical protein
MNFNFDDENDSNFEKSPQNQIVSIENLEQEAEHLQREEVKVE